MEKKYLLHMLTSAKNLSPFDANMAYDAGWDACIPYIQVESDEVKGLVEDAIFSRGPNGVKRTGPVYRWARHASGNGNAGDVPEIHGAAIRGLGICRPQRGIYNGGRNGGKSRESVA